MPRRPRARPLRVLAAPDKFRGTATAPEIAAAIARAAARLGWECTQQPMADGGEGTLDCFGGANRETVVTGPLGDPVTARWRLDGRTAVIECAQASGIALVGGPTGNDPIAADTTGTGELIMAAVEASARRVVVAVGGSASTDGGLGALRALQLPRLRGVELVVACDVRIGFVDAAEVFAPQKGASDAEVELLRRRLERLAEVYEESYSVDVRDLEGAGAAGGLAGGLAVAGAKLVSGFDLIADEVELHEAIEGASLVVTGEGFVDAESFDGKVVGGVVDLAAAEGVPAFVVAGQVFDDVADRAEIVSLTDRYGEARAMAETAALVEEVVAERLAQANDSR